jgi:hypothetical protein
MTDRHGVDAKGAELPGAELPDEATIPVRRTQQIIATDTDGSTFIARRETRRRATREHVDGQGPVGATDRLPPSSAPIEASGRVAAAPDAAARAVYSARAPEPVIASRTAPPERVPQAPVDGDAAATAQRRRARRTALIVLISASAVALTAAGSLLVVALTT